MFNLFGYLSGIEFKFVKLEILNTTFYLLIQVPYHFKYLVCYLYETIGHFAKLLYILHEASTFLLHFFTICTQSGLNNSKLLKIVYMKAIRIHNSSLISGMVYEIKSSCTSTAISIKQLPKRKSLRTFVCQYLNHWVAREYPIYILYMRYIINLLVSIDNLDDTLRAFGSFSPNY